MCSQYSFDSDLRNAHSTIALDEEKGLGAILKYYFKLHLAAFQKGISSSVIGPAGAGSCSGVR
jgi:hypothetical protein